MTIYELADIAGILGIEKSRVKSWTIGRPFCVRPSVRAALGKGSRNLFSRNDVYCFALVKRLNEAGVPVACIQGMLENLRPNFADDKFWKDQNWILITRKGSDFSYDIDFGAKFFIQFEIDPEHNIACVYAVNVKSVREAVLDKINFLTHPKTRPSRPDIEKGGKKRNPNKRRVKKQI